MEAEPLSETMVLYDAAPLRETLREVEDDSDRRGVLLLEPP